MGKLRNGLLAVLMLPCAALAQNVPERQPIARLGVPMAAEAPAELPPAMPMRFPQDLPPPVFSDQMPVAPYVPFMPMPMPAPAQYYVQAPSAIQPPVTTLPKVAPSPKSIPEPATPILEPTVSQPSTRFYGGAEFVFWWVQGNYVPPLVTASPPGTPQASAGVLGAPGTTILFGDDRVNSGMRPGGRFTLGYWFNDAQTFGIEAGLMFLSGRSASFVAGADGSQIISRPYLDATTDLGAAELVSFPGIVRGAVSVAADSDPMIIGDLAFRHALCCDCNRRIYFLAGYRYLYFAESLEIREDLTSLDPLTLDTNIRVTDSFQTRNSFNGGLLGIEGEWVYGLFSLRVSGKLALGNLYREVTIAGNTVIAAPGAAPIAYNGGLLTQSSNSGTFSSNHFVFIPELGLTAGCQITPGIRATVGYSLLWLNDFVRPGEQIDRSVNPNLIPPALPSAPVRPLYTLRETDFWVQGIRLGLEFRF